MVGLSRLYLGMAGASDALRYGRRTGSPPAERRPVVVWNVTQRCNLRCRHCYAHAAESPALPELTTREGCALIDDLAGYGAPVLLFSGGEPLLREDLPELAARAVGQGLRAVLSTNGTLLSPARARLLAEIGVAYVGVSLDGLAGTHDRFRGCRGAFERALAGIRACREAGVKVGLRYTVTRANLADVPGVLDLVAEEGIPRVCFYHLVYAGRGAALASEDLSHAQTRELVDRLITAAAGLQAEGQSVEVLTVDNHCDGPLLWLRMVRERHPRADRALALLRRNGGNSTGAGIGCVSWDGTVFPDQFWRNHALGNVRERPFSGIWTDRSNPFLARLRDKARHLHGRCAACRFLDVCGGNFRARAEAATGDPWACDPACYLTDEEIRPD